MKSRILIWICRRLPKTLVYYCATNLVAYSTTGKYSNTIVPEITAMDALKRYADDHKCY